jgi:hypothetical protein
VKRRWRIVGPRFFCSRETSKYYAEIFGAPKPRCRWAWAVYGPKLFCRQGIVSSLAVARRQSNEAIDEILGDCKAEVTA